MIKLKASIVEWGVKIYGSNSTKRGARLANKDKALFNILKDLNSHTIYWSQIEGTYYKKALFQQIIEIIERHFNYKEVEELYEREEIYFPTVLRNLPQSSSIRISDGGLYTYVPWGRSTLATNLTEVRAFLADANCCYFSVKRVDRQLNNYVRMYIRQHASYSEELSKYVKGIKEVEDNKLIKLEKNYQRRLFIQRKWKVIKYYFTNTGDIINILKDKFIK